MCMTKLVINSQNREKRSFLRKISSEPFSGNISGAHRLHLPLSNPLFTGIHALSEIIWMYGIRCRRFLEIRENTAYCPAVICHPVTAGFKNTNPQNPCAPPGKPRTHRAENRQNTAFFHPKHINSTSLIRHTHF